MNSSVQGMILKLWQEGLGNKNPGSGQHGGHWNSEGQEFSSLVGFLFIFPLWHVAQNKGSVLCFIYQGFSRFCNHDLFPVDFNIFNERVSLSGPERHRHIPQQCIPASHMPLSAPLTGSWSFFSLL